MTVSMMVKGISHPSYSTSEDRFSSGESTGATGFEEALDSKTKRVAPRASLAAPDARPSWPPRSLDSAFGYGAADADAGEATDDDLSNELAALAETELPGIDSGLPGLAEADLYTEAMPIDLPGNEAAAALSETGPQDVETGQAERAVEDARTVAREYQATVQVQAATQAGGAPEVSHATAPLPALTPGDRLGDQRGRTPSPSVAGAALTRTDLASPSATMRPGPVPAEIVEKAAARFVPAREQWSQAHFQAKPLPQGQGNAGFEGQVKIVGYSSALAPSPAVLPMLGTTSAGVIAAIEGEHTWRAAAAESGALSGQRAQTLASGVNTLRIQLQPIELGMVTARLSVNGEQLSLELQVESNDARQRLANDSNLILKALRGLGFDIDKITIQQTTQTSQSSSSAGAQSGSERENFEPNQQAHGDADHNGQGGNRSSDAREGETAGSGQVDAVADRAGSNLYI